MAPFCKDVVSNWRFSPPPVQRRQRAFPTRLSSPPIPRARRRGIAKRRSNRRPASNPTASQGGHLLESTPPRGAGAGRSSTLPPSRGGARGGGRRGPSRRSNNHGVRQENANFFYCGILWSLDKVLRRMWGITEPVLGDETLLVLDVNSYLIGIWNFKKYLHLGPGKKRDQGHAERLACGLGMSMTA
ncbi:uncharacterized protein LOC101761013 [Setaria italica]|uniref:uncharacterized protein LOC101761013 n=1 Tax=Setaria italica TaxID=4555 RepID=UPI000350FCDE|nr:uncharacterized protein LOC101761013 [Setaria italica]